MSLRNVVDWDGKYDSQPFIVATNASTGTVTTENTAGYVISNAYSLRCYANDGVAGKFVSGTGDFPAITEENFRIKAVVQTSIAESAWLSFYIQLNKFDGVNRSGTALYFDSGYSLTKEIKVLDSTSNWATVAGSVWRLEQNEWCDIELVGTFNASGVAPDYKYLKVADTTFTTFPSTGRTVASATVPHLDFGFAWTPSNGAAAYMYIDSFSLEVF